MPEQKPNKKIYECDRCNEEFDSYIECSNHIHEIHVPYIIQELITEIDVYE